MEKASISIIILSKTNGFNVRGGIGSGWGWKKLRFQLKSFRKLTAPSSGAARERPGMEKASILIKSLEKTNGFERQGGGRERPRMEKASILIKIL